MTASAAAVVLLVCTSLCSTVCFAFVPAATPSVHVAKNGAPKIAAHSFARCARGPHVCAWSGNSRSVGVRQRQAARVEALYATDSEGEVTEAKEGEKSKLPFFLDPNTRGGAVVVPILTAALPIGLYWYLVSTGMDGLKAGNYSAVAYIVFGLCAWAGTYLYRVATKSMTYAVQLKQYEDAVIERRFNELTEEEVEALLQEVEEDNEDGMMMMEEEEQRQRGKKEGGGFFGLNLSWAGGDSILGGSGGGGNSGAAGAGRSGGGGKGVAVGAAAALSAMTAVMGGGKDAKLEKSDFPAGYPEDYGYTAEGLKRYVAEQLGGMAGDMGDVDEDEELDPATFPEGYPKEYGYTLGGLFRYTSEQMADI